MRYRNRSLELTAKKGTYEAYPIYANRVDIERTASTEDWLIVSLTVNFGASIFGFSEDSKEQENLARKAFEAGGLSTSGQTIIAYPNSPADEDVFYTIDISRLIPAGWEYEITRVGKSLNRIGLIAFKPGLIGELESVHILNANDLRNGADETCAEIYEDRWRNDQTGCQRESGHLGHHQSIDKGYVYDWSTGGGASRSPYLMYGFTCRCPYCGHVAPGGNTGEQVCFTCEHWLSLEKRRDENSFIIGGRHYRPGAGGFGGRKFKVRRNNDSIWEGELFTQGEVPSWMRDRFPDNAQFVTEKREGNETNSGKVVYSGSLAEVQSVAWAELRRLSELNP